MLHGLDDGDLRVLRVIADMPLANEADVTWGLQERTEERVRDRLDRLRKEGMVDSARISFLGPQGERYWRYWLTDRAQVQLKIQGASWNQPGCLMRLLERLPAIEWFYPAAAQITGMGRFQAFQWLDGRSFDAAVRYEDGWMALFWMGLLRSEKGVGDRLKDLGRDLEELASGHPQPRPGLLCFVVPDLWECELVRRVAGRLGMEEWVAIWCVRDGSWHGPARPTLSWGWVRQPVYRRTDSWGAWKKRVRESCFSEEGNGDPRELLRRVRPALREAMGDQHAADRWVERARRELKGLEGPGGCIPWLRRAQMSLDAEGLARAAAIVGRVARYLADPDPPADTARLLLGITEWSGMSTLFAQVVLGEGPTGRRAQRALLRLLDWGMVRRWRDDKVMRYQVTREAFRLLAVMDRTSAEAMWSTLRMDDWTTGRVSESHQYGVMDVAAHFLAAGCPVAAGWRENLPMGYSGGIVPDWMVLLSNTTFLPGWHYGEYERSAQDPDPVTKKMTGFDSPLRVNSWPVLVVSASDTAEQVFHDVGAGMGLPMLTTTIDRARQHGVAGGAGCWRLPAYLGGSFFLDPGEQPALG